MTRADLYRNLLIGACAAAALSIAPGAVAAAADACPAPAPNHVPDPPPPPLNLGTIKNLLLDYHAKHYNDDLAAVFESARKFIEQNAARSKRPALVLDIDETSLTNWPNLAADDFGFIADGSCDVLPAGAGGFHPLFLQSMAAGIRPAGNTFNVVKGRAAAAFFTTARPPSHPDATFNNLDPSA